ncbi:alpha/beta fold hydrolase [Pseudoroseicyclus tamaricis]|uniref:Alpha/beta fold hydrolase n=1 Tax=Pseudoroseicyclus tamaricis TaxID=2705421 RepID=A0A6B2JPM9_9RHOB|nr:alpha/beta fold hydrolase [Pseudoroseicyclus tamaricis]NDV00637.1 alpha/beta fold hydrolase [Pseudoroseicyclus tamaricis]
MGLLVVLIVALALTLAVRQQRARAEAAFPPEGRLIEVAGRQVHAVEAGSGPTVILVHGAGGNLRDFTFDLAGRLEGRYHVVAFDRPGLGHSEALPGTPSPTEQARQLEAAAEAMGLGPAVIVGHSYGGAVAMAWGQVAPERAAAIVTLAGATMPWEGPYAAFYHATGSWWARWTTAPLISAFAGKRQIAASLEGIFAPQPAPPGYVDHVGAALTLRRASLAANGRQVLALREDLAEQSARYGQMRMPVEIIHGTADRTVDLDIHARGMLRLLPDANLTVLEGVGHMPHHADPEATVAAIDRAAARAGLI